MRRFEELLHVARWEAYRDRMHCHQRRRAFVSDAYKSRKDWRWTAKRMPSGGVVVRLYFWLRGDVNKYDGFHPEDGKPMLEQLSECVERLTLEALQDVARATKNRLDSKAARS